MNLDNHWIPMVELSGAVGATRHSMDVLKKMQRPKLRKIIDPASAKRNKYAYNVSDIVAWLSYSIQLTGAQRDEIVSRSRLIIPGEMGEAT